MVVFVLEFCLLTDSIAPKDNINATNYGFTATVIGSGDPLTPWPTFAHSDIPKFSI